jgi:hypothetical protein
MSYFCKNKKSVFICFSASSAFYVLVLPAVLTSELRECSSNILLGR